VKHLAALTRLTELHLGKTQATGKGWAERQKALPKCRVGE
jgi:hypothetical protein